MYVVYWVGIRACRRQEAVERQQIESREHAGHYEREEAAELVALEAPA